MFGCKHKFGKIQKDGYQYCLHCGIAIAPPLISCQHLQWEDIEIVDIEWFGISRGKIYVQKCKKCKKIISHRIDGGKH